MKRIDWWRVFGLVVLPLSSWAVIVGLTWLVLRAVRP